MRLWTLELVELLRARGTLLVIGALALSAVLALVQGIAHQHGQAQTLQAAYDYAEQRVAAAHAEAVALNSDPDRKPPPYWRDPRDVAGWASFGLSVYAGKPPLPAAALNRGQSDLYPYYLALGIDSRDKALGSHELYNPHQLQAGAFDLAFVAIFILPLALIALGHGVGSRERDSGMDRLLAVATPRPGAVVLRRLLWRAGLAWSAVAVPVLLAVPIGAVALSTGELAAWLGLAVAYVLFWSGVIGLLATRARTPARAAFVLLGVWVALLVVVPALANFAARTLAPVPPRSAFVQEMRDATDAISRARLSVLEQYFVDHPEFAPAQEDLNLLPFTIARIVTVQELEQRMAPVEADYREALDRQHRLLEGFELLSPGLWLQGAFNRFSGTDLARHRDFLEQALAYQQGLRDYFHPRILAMGADPDYRVCVDCPGASRSLEHFDFPRYHYRPYRACVTEGAGLWLMLALALALCLATARRRY